MSPYCGQCGSFVTRDFERVFKPEGMEQVPACPDCPDGEMSDTIIHSFRS